MLIYRNVAMVMVATSRRLSRRVNTWSVNYYVKM